MDQKGDLLFGPVASEWTERRRNEWKASTWVRYQNILRCHLLPEFAQVPITEITREKVDNFRIRLLQGSPQESSTLSPKTVTNNKTE